MKRFERPMLGLSVTRTDAGDQWRTRPVLDEPTRPFAAQDALQHRRQGLRNHRHDIGRRGARWRGVRASARQCRRGAALCAAVADRLRCRFGMAALELQLQTASALLPNRNG